MANPKGAELCEQCREWSYDQLMSTDGITLGLRADLRARECDLCVLFEKAILACPNHIPDDRFSRSSENILGNDLKPDETVRVRVDTRHSSLPLSSVLFGMTVASGTPTAFGTAKPADTEMDGGYLGHVYNSERHICQASVPLTAWEGTPNVPSLAAISRRTSAPDSAAQYHLISEWLRACAADHNKCKLVGAILLPRRLVDISNSKRLKLIETAGSGIQPESYVALSYCWGQGPFSYPTTKDNVEEREDSGFVESILPRTIRDAVRISRRLDKRYLWVDALCILQGGDQSAREEWAHESERMCSVYQGAYATIAAARASNVNEGVFPVSYPVSTFGVDTRLHSLTPPRFSGVVRAGVYDDFTESAQEPLHGRGWTLQERVMSRRVLIFNRDQIAWECQTLAWTESGRAQRDLGSMRLPTELSSLSKEDQNTLPGAHSGEASSRGETRAELRDRWQAAVKDYSGRAISVASDKLPAIAGLARVFRDRHGDEYLAGLWRSTLLEDLMWYHDPYRSRGRDDKPFPAQYRAPSWSWAAVNGRVDFDRADREELKVGYHATIVGCSFTPRFRGNEFGEITAGVLKLRGLLKDGRGYEHELDTVRRVERQVKRQAMGSGNGNDVTQETTSVDMPAIRFRLCLDGGVQTQGTWTDPLSLSGLWFLRLIGCASLVLQSAGGSDAEPAQFRRVGISKPSAWDKRPLESCAAWFAGCEETTVTMI